MSHSRARCLRFRLLRRAHYGYRRDLATPNKVRRRKSFHDIRCVASTSCFYMHSKLQRADPRTPISTFKVPSFCMREFVHFNIVAKFTSFAKASKNVYCHNVAWLSCKTYWKRRSSLATYAQSMLAHCCLSTLNRNTLYSSGKCSIWFLAPSRKFYTRRSVRRLWILKKNIISQKSIPAASAFFQVKASD